MATPVADIIVKWSGKEFKISGLDEKETVADLKKALLKETGVLPERQKLLGLKYKGKPPTDDVQLCALKLKPNIKIMMMGTREENLAEFLTPPTDLPEVINDFDIEEDEIAIENREEYLAKIEKRVKEYKIDIISEPRPDKKLLVLDIDYTLFDHKSTAETGHELMRPFLHEFLMSAYEDYDIVIWSATSMKWIKAKMEELGVAHNPNYKLTFMVDDLAMITINTPKYGVIDGYKLTFMVDDLAMITINTPLYGVIDVKPLGVIWGKYPHWNQTNTIMFDDLRRNFIMNPQNGLKIRPFRQAHLNRDKDRELYKLTKYLKDIAPLEDLSVLNHRKWERYRPKKLKKSDEGRSRENRQEEDENT